MIKVLPLSASLTNVVLLRGPDSVSSRAKELLLLLLFESNPMSSIPMARTKPCGALMLQEQEDDLLVN